MSTLIVMVGLPGSGKDTWITNFLKTERGENFKVVGTDLVLEEIAAEKGLTYGDVFNDHIKEAEKIMNQRVQEYSKAGVDVIWNQTNLSAKKRKKILHIFNKYQNKFAVSIVIDKSVHLQRLEERSKRENKTIPVNVILDMMDSRTEPSLDEGFNSIMVLDTSGETPELVSFTQAH